ncbi:MAG: carboxylating nicotinate-nucleotide diphosphorylase [Nitrospiraceae bacterium]|nr:carboxylating nicotinate-nucleotide diphosphorylase [Nitrospiraceae bacterium]
MMDDSLLLKETIRIAIYEDIGHGDITSLLIVPEYKKAKASIIAKEDLILAGMPFIKEVFNAIDPGVEIQIFFDEGSRVKKGDIIAKISGSARSLLAGERISLNILQRISGIATMTNQYVKKVNGLPVKIADTRKTIPGMRLMEKYGVRIGGGVNHRFGLYDGILIKDNHIKVAGGVKRAIELAKKGHHLLKIEVEVKNLDELKEALDAGADVIMLDNMSITDMKKAVKIAKGKAILEASGNVNLENIRSIAETGVDIISIGALTHSARAVDTSMKIV